MLTKQRGKCYLRFLAEGALFVDNAYDESWFRVSNFGFVFRVSGLVEAQGLLFRVWGVGFRVQGLGSRV